ncbi:hypothetical protein FOZ62_020713, partial [Perkinsus olseni]
MIVILLMLDNSDDHSYRRHQVCSAADTTCITCGLKLESVNSRWSDGHTPTQRGFSIKGFALRSGAPLQEFTTCQVQRHNRVNDCWICAHGKV